MCPKPLINLDEIVEHPNFVEYQDCHIPKFPIVCICGSMRFKKEWEKWACILSELEPMHVVLMAHCFDHDKYHGEDKGNLRLKRGLDLLHWFKIKLADWVFIIDVDGYIGESTRREIKVAEKLGKTVRYMSEWGDKK